MCRKKKFIWLVFIYNLLKILVWVFCTVSLPNRIYQLNLCINSSLHHYQNACSQRCTYQQICRKFYLTCKIEKEKLGRRVKVSDNLEEDFGSSALRRKRFIGSDTIPDYVDFLPTSIFKTPTKMPIKELIGKGTADPEIACCAQE